MFASIYELQISNPETKKRIIEVIQTETIGLSNDHVVSIIATPANDTYDFWIQQPDGRRITTQLHEDLGELTPAVLRIRLRELLKQLWQPKRPFAN